MWKNHWIITFQHRFPEFVRLYFFVCVFLLLLSSPSFIRAMNTPSAKQLPKPKLNYTICLQFIALLWFYFWSRCDRIFKSLVLLLLLVCFSIGFFSTMFCYCCVHFNHKITESNHVFICCVSMIFACCKCQNEDDFFTLDECIEIVQVNRSSSFTWFQIQSASPFDTLYFSF